MQSSGSCCRQWPWKQMRTGESCPCHQCFDVCLVAQKRHSFYILQTCKCTRALTNTRAHTHTHTHAHAHPPTHTHTCTLHIHILSLTTKCFTREQEALDAVLLPLCTAAAPATLGHCHLEPEVKSPYRMYGSWEGQFQRIIICAWVG